MKDWALHHIHFVIILDALLHGGMIALIAAAWVVFARFAKIVASKSALVPLVAMGAMMGFLSWYVVALAYFCVTHYATWWSR